VSGSYLQENITTELVALHRTRSNVRLYSTPAQEGALSGVKILDLSRVLAVCYTSDRPSTSTMLAKTFRDRTVPRFLQTTALM
jgi:hypothetical protein